jgi:hypothetical protein
MDPDPDADPNPSLFIIDLQDADKKLKIKSKKEITKQKKSRFFLLFLLNDRRIQKAQKHVDPVDPDSDPDPQPVPQHCHCVIHLPKGYDTTWYWCSHLIGAFFTY